MLEHATRWALKHEVMPTRLLWWMAADAMGQWYRMLRSGLADALGGKEAAGAMLARLAAPVYERHYDALATRHAELPSRQAQPRAVGLLLGGLTRVGLSPRARFMFTEVGGGPSGVVDQLRVERLLAPLSLQERWEEVTTHLGEVLIALTTGLPRQGLSQANALLGRLCFDGGVKYAEQMRRAFDLPRTPASAIEVLRTSEYIFRVNPEHWGHADAASHSGYLEGTACPWYSAEGWSMMHCGVFGQFQSGISSVFGLRYQLTRTIPKHGGHTCRIDLRPVAGAR